MDAEKRRYPRIEVPIDGTWDGASGRRHVRIISVSLGGCFVDAMGTPNPGERVVLSLDIPDQPPLALSGRVAYLSRPQGFGVTFEPLPLPVQRLLVAALKSLGLTNPYGASGPPDPAGSGVPTG